jgi:hypothetical protein
MLQSCASLYAVANAGPQASSGLEQAVTQSLCVRTAAQPDGASPLVPLTFVSHSAGRVSSRAPPGPGRACTADGLATLARGHGPAAGRVGGGGARAPAASGAATLVAAHILHLTLTTGRQPVPGNGVVGGAHGVWPAAGRRAAASDGHGPPAARRAHALARPGVAAGAAGRVGGHGGGLHQRGARGGWGSGRGAGTGGGGGRSRPPAGRGGRHRRSWWGPGPATAVGGGAGAAGAGGAEGPRGAGVGAAGRAAGGPGRAGGPPCHWSRSGGGGGQAQQAQPGLQQQRAGPPPAPVKLPALLQAAGCWHLGCMRGGGSACTQACEGCGLARYCGPGCQRAHWPLHHAQCLRWRGQLGGGPAQQAGATVGAGRGAAHEQAGG